MAEYEIKNPIDFRRGGDTVHDLTDKYISETTRIYRFLNDLKTNSINAVEYTEPSAGQLKVADNTIYIRNTDNTEWVELGKVANNFGFLEQVGSKFIGTGDISKEKIAELNSVDLTKALTTDNLGNTAGKIPTLNEDGKLPVNVTGSAGKIGNININVSEPSDGQSLMYRASTNTWVNENKLAVGGIIPWEARKQYYINDVCLVDTNIYICVYEHESGDEFEQSREMPSEVIGGGTVTVALWKSIGINLDRGVIAEVADEEIVTHNNSADAHPDIREAMKHISGVPLGTVIPFSGNNALPNGFLLCNGASVARTMYPDLFNIIGTTYGAVDSEHFNLPDLRDKFIEGGTAGGAYKEAGLPNITGNFTAFTLSGGTSGAINSIPVDGGFDYPAGISSLRKLLDFDASKSNPIYGKSTTVQPPALTMRYIIKAFDGQTEEGALIDVTQYANELNNIKANYLPLSGGKVTGPIYGPGDRSTLLLTSEPDLLNGSYLALDGKDEPNTAGSFRLEAGEMVDGVRKGYMLIGRTDGSLKWCNQPVATTNKLSMPSFPNNIALSAPAGEYATFTAPADGFMFFRANSSSESAYVNYDIGGFAMNVCAPKVNYFCSTLVPISKGSICNYLFPQIANLDRTAFFIYTKSEV